MDTFQDITKVKLIRLASHVDSSTLETWVTSSKLRIDDEVELPGILV